jgi:Ca2+-binding EF-hand superfamily protein
MRKALTALTLACSLPLVLAATADAGTGKGKGKDKGKQQKQVLKHDDHGAHDGHMRFHGVDQNNDGRITRAEWPGNDVSFREHDWNGDGVLSGDEVRPGARRDDDDFEVPFDRFEALDVDNNGVLTRAEWRGSAALFDRLDRNDDGAISRREFLDRILTGDDRFGLMDVNDDGRISRAEWRGTAAAFDRLDRDDDGFLSLAEFLRR